MKNKKLLIILLSFIILFIPINQFSFALCQKDLVLDESISSLNIIPLNELVDKVDENNIGYIEGEFYKGEINLNTGDITHYYYNEDYSISNIFTTNYYENLGFDINSNNDLNLYASRKIISKNEAWKLAYLVQTLNSKSDEIQINNSKGQNKKYTKKINTYYSGNTKGFIDSVDKAKPAVDRLVSIGGLSLLVGLFAYFGFAPASIAAIKTWLVKAGFTGLVSSASFIASSFETYQVNAKKADHYWDMI